MAADRAAQARRPPSTKPKYGLTPAHENGLPESDSSFLDSETEVDAAAAAATKGETATSSKGPKTSGGDEEPASSPKRKGPPSAASEQKFDVLTAVDYATDFCQQIVLPATGASVSRAFHAMWCRPFGPPRVIYVDPDQRWMSGEFQQFLRHHSITLLDCAAESHWQLGRVEIAQKILRGMAQRVWRTAERPPEEVIESCSAIRNEQLKRHGFSSSQWFLGREPRVPGSLADITERNNVAAQDAVLSERDFAQKMQLRQHAAEAFLQAHAHSVWERAIRGQK